MAKKNKSYVDASAIELSGALDAAQRDLTIGLGGGRRTYFPQSRFYDYLCGKKDAGVLRGELEANAEEDQWIVTPGMLRFYNSFHAALALERRDTAIMQYAIRKRDAELREQRKTLESKVNKRGRAVSDLQQQVLTDVPTTAAEKGQSTEQLLLRRKKENDKATSAARVARAAVEAELAKINEDLVALAQVFSLHEVAFRDRALVLSHYYQLRQATYVRAGVGDKTYARISYRLPPFVPSEGTGVPPPPPVWPEEM